MPFDPAWLNAAFFGAVVSLGLLAGVAAALWSPIEHRGIARVMAAGAGILMAAASLELLAEAVEAAGPWASALAFALGAAAFSGLNALLSAGGAKHRKRCGVCVQQPSETGRPGSGAAILAGTLMDALPEAAVLGLAVAAGAPPSAGLVAAFLLGNFAEALSSASGMQVAGRPRAYVLAAWLAAGALIVTIAAASAAIAHAAPSATAPACQALAAGALVAMIVEVMIPEATHDTASFNGALAAAGFLAVVALLAV